MDLNKLQKRREYLLKKLLLHKDSCHESTPYFPISIHRYVIFLCASSLLVHVY